MNARRRRSDRKRRVPISPNGLQLDDNGALYGDALIAELARFGCRVKRYGDQAGLDDEVGLGRVPPLPFLFEFRQRQDEYSAALLRLKAPQASLPSNDREATRSPHALNQATAILAHLKVGFPCLSMSRARC